MCNILKSYFQIGSSSSPSYSHIFFLIAVLDKDCIRNIIQLLYYALIKICINNNNNIIIIIINCVKLQDLTVLLKLPKACQRIFSKFKHNLGMCPQKGSSVLAQMNCGCTLRLAASDIIVTSSVTYKGVSKSFETSSIDHQPMAVRE
jgi:hypothetical protein